MNNITAAALVHLAWNDDSNEWEIIPADLTGNLDWAYEDDGRPYAPVVSAALDRASNHPITAEELTHMLGFAMVRATAPLSEDVEWRSVSPSLVGMLKDALPVPVMGTSDRDAYIRRLLPIFSSVDENAHRRGVADQRATTNSVYRDAVRAAISNAYYDARNAGETMEQGADRATASVMALLGVED